MLRPDHPDTLISRNNLAAALHTAGRLAEALPMSQQTLADFERLLGPDHRNTLTTRNNLAAALQDTGRLAEALPLYQQTLAEIERLLGPDHTDTLSSRHNLAGALQDAGRLTEALPLYERALAGFERLLGPYHPTVAAALYRREVAVELEALADVHQRLGDLSAAIHCLGRALDIRRQTEGANSPHAAGLMDRLRNLSS